ncbi:5'-nucleotidase [Raineyella antarctica]|uniref:5'-nucleotidase n=1 Tax=Raineyella antarctica TaxID=1577474 RepID=A0A1G6GF83_9ACTN|nr:5'/3'-nucleotidase SurE [Raineyella antarctica]SDB80672.1 5'-nucleotidase [Raineyella antarctica]
MQILITNDDGIDSPGLAAMARAAIRRGHQVLVVAPDRPSSGASASIGMRTHNGRPIVQEEHPDGMPKGVRSLVVEATPAQIVYLAAQGEFGPGPGPAMVLSGINAGANTGRAILHSGTIGVALTASVLGIRTMAVSVNGTDPVHWDTAEDVAVRMMEWAEFQPSDGRILNVNIPDVPLYRLRGLREAPLAMFGALQAADIDFPDDPVSAVRRVPVEFEPEFARLEPGTDHYLLERDWVTATMLRGMVDDFSGVHLPPLEQVFPIHSRLHAVHRRPPWSE